MRSVHGGSGGMMAMVTLVLTLAVATIGEAQPLSTAPGAPGVPQGRASQPSQPSRDPARRPSTESATVPATAVIRGRAVTLDSGQPLRRVQIIARGDVQQRRPRSVMTDDEGRYELKELPQGRYTLMAMKSGYVTLTYGQRGPHEPGRPIELADGQRLDKVDFHMPRGSAITGRIVDEFGEPLSDVTVNAMTFTWVASGTRRLVPAGRTAMTNDLGQYRLYGLPPDDYVVSATARDAFRATMLDENSEGSSSGYAPTFYPGTADAAAAQRLTLGIGQEASADIQLTALRAVRVSGTAVDAAGLPIDEGYVQLRSRGDVYAPGGTRNGEVKKGGTFTIQGVTPGSYMVLLDRGGRPGGERKEAAFTPVTVGGEDVTDLRLMLSRGTTIRGRVLFDGGQPASAAAVQVMCSTRDLEFSLPSPRVPTVRADGGFELEGVFAPCLIAAGVRSGSDPKEAEWVVKSVRQGGSDITERPIEVSERSDIEIVLTNRVTTLTGTVTGPTAAPVLDYTLVTFTEDKSLWGTTTARVRASRPDQAGVAKARALPPGDYLVAAVERLEQGAEWDPETLARLASHATRVTLTEGGTQTVAVTLAAFP